MKHYLLFIILISLFGSAAAQEQDNRRAYYYETFKEVDAVIDSIVVFKSNRTMVVYRQGERVKAYIISLGMEPIGAKQFEGDYKTPEGLYYIDDRNAVSSYHKNLNINYPNEQDSIYAAERGLSAGGEIKIHGFPNRHRKDQEKELLNSDWTLGCIAISDFEIDQLYYWVKDMCPILILP